MPPRPQLDPAEVDGSYLKGTGPGGQKINKTNSAVQLIHKPTGIVVKCQATRSRSQNQKLAMQILAEKVELLQKGDQSRAAIVRAAQSKRKANRARKARRKYRRLDGRDEATDSEVARDDDDDDADRDRGLATEITGDETVRAAHGPEDAREKRADVT
ncbi:hypothetical protein KEM52_006583 [Ascosphaera acerosa]|nr:hypothetical protein KEM52_006583 [Ascosphaera acerosa]